MATQALQESAGRLLSSFRSVRRLSEEIAAPLSDADATIQPMPDASPAKWHLAHTTWFFETFVLRDHLPGYRCHDESWAFLFNSYYEGEGERHERPKRGMLSRPSLDEIRDYRRSIDARLQEALPDLAPEALAIVELGLNHEQQHQELMLMDLLATFAENPLCPVVWDSAPAVPAALPPPIRWLAGREGLVEIGHDGPGFAFDCELPRHKVHLRRHALADRLISNGEWLRFIDEGGYRQPLLWLADGWAWVGSGQIEAPLYWRRGEDGWMRFGLDGMKPVNPAEPVCHISYYEAEAFARWADARLPTEAEWEATAQGEDPAGGNQLDSAGPARPTGDGGWYGDAWNWTGSAFLPFPGFRPAEGAVGEYNGKFMCSQMVLRGGCCATPRGHLRASYRNFYYPWQRWMFSGLRLAKDI
jgi:ergothioneine biosynthesis protein EgtB